MDPTTPPWRALEAVPTPSEPSPATGSSLRGWVPIACFAMALVLAVGAFLVAASGASSGAIAVDGAEPSTTAPGDPGGSAVLTGQLLVEVSGAVTRPGLYRLARGARIADALTAAGGFGPRVDAARADRELNLAAPIHDGDEIRVPSRDDVAGSIAPTRGPGSSGGPLVDLNTATAEQLDALPGIGPATAAKIIAARPFATVGELKSKGVVGDKTLEKLKPLVTVGR